MSKDTPEFEKRIHREPIVSRPAASVRTRAIGFRLRRAWASRPWFWDGWTGLMPFHDTKAHQRWKIQGFYDDE